ncbi:type 1 glutamine amidotransferase [Enterococcus casseliflavus]|uniref:type 1 glutamine amidotransferase n=1 Tax=Enterococcus innesii TaxID=2839759 RepID=UPI002090DF57|nr:type 1 glutamine amidotransferase [Enterococcus innesii]MCO5497675.1 type 1 glutamine amidotransferase [Enterococcus innesii]MEC5315668.1 type 1 glutamine amidotransferase [Enterococcus casseliflavus]
MRINVLQHTPNEGPGSIREWSKKHGHEMYIYHPYQFDGVLPSEEETDMLIILGGPMSPNDKIDWIFEERVLIKKLLDKNIPIFGACYGAQQIAKTLGYSVTKSPHKEVGWAPVYLKSNIIPDIPDKLIALHWHEEMFEVPDNAIHLFSSDLVNNQGYLLGDNVIGLQFHFEPQQDDIREIVINDFSYPEDNNSLNQNSQDIISAPYPDENTEIMFKLLDFISSHY